MGGLVQSKPKKEIGQEGNRNKMLCVLEDNYSITHQITRDIKLTSICGGGGRKNNQPETVVKD